MSDRFGGLIGGSQKMCELYALLETVAKSDVPVLIDGETGTGKELCAEAIWQASGRSKAPYVICDLAGVARNLIESELFGHVRGAFTGADRDRDGVFQAAHTGTIFLDEIGELELEIQPRLLRAIEQRKVKPVGASVYRDVDVRVIAAANRDLQEEISSGRFRADLYHRLAVMRVHLPPLRERREDIPLLVRHFLGERPLVIPPETWELLAGYEWPGNVRELKNSMDRALSLLGEADVLEPTLFDLGESTTTATTWDLGLREEESFRQAKERLVLAWERDFVQELLRRTSGNVSQAAREGRIDRVYLHRLIRKHSLST